MKQTGIKQRIDRAESDYLNKILGRRFPVLDDGFICVVDYMGVDVSVAQAARISFGAGMRKLRDDRALIRYLLSHSHTSPFEMCELKLHVRAPMDVWRQWIRHRTASVNEYSTRYSLAIDSAAKTKPDDWRIQSPVNRQGSEGIVRPELGRQLSREEAIFHSAARTLYDSRIASGIAREQARKDLPLSTYTEAIWKIDLHNLLNFLELRMHESAQLEIREYAREIGERIIKHWVPICWESFLEYRFLSLTLSLGESEVLSLVAKRQFSRALSSCKRYEFVKRKSQREWALTREGRSFRKKLDRLGMSTSWLEGYVGRKTP